MGATGGVWERWKSGARGGVVTAKVFLSPLKALPTPLSETNTVVAA